MDDFRFQPSQYTPGPPSSDIAFVPILDRPDCLNLVVDTTHLVRNDLLDESRSRQSTAQWSFGAGTG